MNQADDDDDITRVVRPSGVIPQVPASPREVSSAATSVPPAHSRGSSTAVMTVVGLVLVGALIAWFVLR